MDFAKGSWLALPGAGSLLGSIGGVLEVLLPFVRPKGFGGTSGGGIVALGLANGIGVRQLGDLLDKFLRRGDLLDKGWPFDQSPGLYRGAKIEGFMREVFGDHTRLGDLVYPARVCVWDSWTNQPAVIDSFAHPDVLVWRAARATMAIEFFFDLVRVREDNARLYGDGGLVLNVPHGLWDDKDEPTIGLRFANQQQGFDVQRLIRAGDGGSNPERVKPVRTWADLVPAVASAALATASASWPSRKRAFAEVVVDVAGDSLKFGLSASEVIARREAGRASGRRAMPRLSKIS
jgi:predicted acylesterase/phospholipase RssA